MRVSDLSIKTPGFRSRINAYTSSIIITIAAFFYMTQVNFLPGSPFFPLFIAVILGFSAIYKNPKWASTGLAIIVLLSIVWQFIGFGLLKLSSNLGLLCMMVIFFFLGTNLLTARHEPTSMALAVLAVAMMLTPQYYLSVAFIVAAAAIGGLQSIGTISITYIFTVLPFVVLENGLRLDIYNPIIGPLPPGTMAPPVIFSFLTYFTQNMRPPLMSLNFILTGVPADFISPQSSQVIKYMSGSNIITLIVPMIILGLVFSLATAFASVINTVLDKLSVFEKISQLVKMVSPIVASVVAPLTFVLLIVNLSPMNTGGYITSLTHLPGDSISMVLASLILGAVFTGREYLIQWFERAEKVRTSITELIKQANEFLNSGLSLTNRMRSETPAINIGTEDQVLVESRVYLDDVNTGLSTASLQSLIAWRDEIEDRVVPRIMHIPEILRMKVIGELNLLNSLSATYNVTLKETGVTISLPELTDIKVALPFNDAVASYSKLTGEVKKTGSSLFEEYRTTTMMYDKLMDQGEMIPPVDPSSLFETYDYATGIKLIAEEYWLNFHVRNNAEFEAKLQSLRGAIEQLSNILGEPQSIEAREILKGLTNLKPADSKSVSTKIDGLRIFLLGLLGIVEAELNQLDKLVKTLMPGATRHVTFQVMQIKGKLDALIIELKTANSSIGEMTRLSKDMHDFLSVEDEYKKADEKNLVIVSQYPAARKIISDSLMRSSKIKVIDLPFQRSAAITFSRLYSFNNPKVKFDEDEEVIEAIA